MYEEGHRWSVLAAAVPDLSPAVRVSASIGAGLHATALGLLDEARAYLGDAVAVAEDRALPGFSPRARAHRGDMEWWFDDPDAADADLSAAAAASAPGTPTAHPWVHAFALLHLGRVRLRQERYDEANALFDEAEPLLGELGDAYLAELALRFRARGATIQGDPAAAVALAARALEHAERLGHTEGIAISLLALGEGERALGHLDEAAAVLRRSVEFSVAADHVATVCQGLGLLAAIGADTGDRAGAAELLEKLLPAQAAAGLPLLTPGGVVQGLVDELFGGRYPDRDGRPRHGGPRPCGHPRTGAEPSRLSRRPGAHSEQPARCQRRLVRCGDMDRVPTVSYHLLDVFTDRPYGGNPLAVFVDPGPLSDGEMQRIAGELHRSETVFVWSPTRPDRPWRSRIFTPSLELPFAGPATVGAAFVLAMLGQVAQPGHTIDVVLAEAVGDVRVSVALDEWAAPVRAELLVPGALPVPVGGRAVLIGRGALVVPGCPQ